MRLIFFGPPGSGKGTYASRVKGNFSVPHISTGDIFREEIAKNSLLGKIVEDDVKNGRLVPDVIVNRVVDVRLKEDDCKNGYLFDGFPRTMNQAEFLGKLQKPEKVINLVVSDEIVITRLSARRTCRSCNSIFNVLTLKPKVDGKCDNCGGELYQRDDDKPEFIKRRLVLYREFSEPLIDHYRKKGILRDVVCERIDIPPPEVTPKIIAAIKS